MIRFHTAAESSGLGIVGVVEGIPAGISISTRYIAHQVRRVVRAYAYGRRSSIPSNLVEFLSGVRFGKTEGTPIALLIRPRGMPQATATIACCTIVRKFLEDVGVFIGSHVLSIGSIAVRDRRPVDKVIRRFTKASCGAYKVTEEADKSLFRILDPSVGKRAKKTIMMGTELGCVPGGSFELIATGVPGRLRRTKRDAQVLKRLLTVALTSLGSVRKVKFKFRFGHAQRCRRGEGDTKRGMLVVYCTIEPRARVATSRRSIEPRERKIAAARLGRPENLAVPACSILAESVVTLVLANVVLGEFPGDSITQIRHRYRRVTPEANRGHQVAR